MAASAAISHAQAVGGRGVPNAAGTVNCGGVPGGTSTTGCGGVPGGSKTFTPTLVHSWSNDYAGCSGVTSCVFVLPNNPTSGNLIVAAADLSFTITNAVFTGSGTGCPATWTPIANTTAVTGPILWVAEGVAAGTGACTVTVTLTGGAVTVGITGVEITGQAPSPIDGFGTAAELGGTTLTVSASTATTAAGDYGVAFWCQQLSSTPAASGWTALVNNLFDGNFGQASISSGTTVSAPLSALNGGGSSAGIVVAIK